MADPGLDTNRLVAVVAGVVAAVLLLLAVVPPMLRSDGDDVDPTDDRTDAAPGPDAVPTVGGQPLLPLSAGASPPAPVQWADGLGPVPSNTWWSSAVTGPGATSLWPEPLALRIDEAGETEVAVPVRETRSDGSWVAPFVPALFLEAPGGGATTEVVGHGPLHVVLRLAPEAAGSAEPIDLTLVQGSPLVELETAGAITLRVPGLALADPPGAEAERRSLRVTTAEGPWLLAAAEPFTATVDGDRLTIRPGADRRVVLGPAPAGADADAYDRVAREVAGRPLEATEERIEVAPDGTTTQVLTQRREGATGDAAALWVLRPHHVRAGAEGTDGLGTITGTGGRQPVAAGSDLRLVYPAVPVLWSAVALPDAPRVVGTDDLGIEGRGSYFGGKAAYAAAARADALRAVGDEAGATRAEVTARQLLDGLLDPGGSPTVRWDDRWGSVVIEPAEFGSGTELNDHQLQYGYWVAAAAHLAQHDPEAAERYREVIDLLVADYAGASTLPGSPPGLPDERTWSPYAGHSWASGTAPFGDGNNLESISESNLAWWAAARWLIATDRSDRAEVFLGRFTIETALVGDAWLPQGDQLPRATAHRPWTGVVWNGKADQATWFDPRDESALGIRLLPVGPAGLARYGSTEALDAADARWRWCEADGGCTDRWANLLDSDAAVAGRAQVTGPDPEPSTDPLLATWWRDLWDRTTVVEGWTCSIGVVPRRHGDGSITILASSPGPEPAQLWCRDASGTTRWADAVRGTAVGEVRPGR